MLRNIFLCSLHRDCHPLYVKLSGALLVASVITHSKDHLFYVLSSVLRVSFKLSGRKEIRSAGIFVIRSDKDLGSVKLKLSRLTSDSEKPAKLNYQSKLFEELKSFCLELR